MEYIKPTFLDNDEVSEGIYATGSGSNCWNVTYEIKQRNSNPYDPFVNIRIKGEHIADHTSSKLEIKVVFDQAVTSAVFDFGGFDCKPVGNVVYLTRINHANGYGSLDNFDSNLRIVTATPDIINVTGISWNCIQG